MHSMYYTFLSDWPICQFLTVRGFILNHSTHTGLCIYYVKSLSRLATKVASVWFCKDHYEQSHFFLFVKTIMNNLILFSRIPDEFRQGTQFEQNETNFKTLDEIISQKNQI